jgi:2-haloacid dehalogenase
MQQRRTFLNNMLGLAVTTVIAPAFLSDSFTTNKIKALAFDAFPIFDPRPVFALAEELFPGKGNELSIVWRTKQFDYQWLRSLTHTYKDFWTVTEDALVFAGNSVKVDLTDEKRMKLMNAYLQLKVWPDVIPALTSIKDAGIKIVFLSNMTKKMLEQNMHANNLDDLFAEVLSTDSNHSYKPAPDAYHIAVDTLKLKKSEIGFVAFAGWDAAGAKSFGYPTYWLNRQHLPMEQLGVAPDWTGDNLIDLASYLK